MAKFLFTVWPFPGHIHPNEAIAHELVMRGHEAAFYTAPSLVERLRSQGFNCFPFKNVDEKKVQEIVRELDALSLHPWGLHRKKELLSEWLLGTVDPQLKDLESTCTNWQPDVLVCDPAMWGPILVYREIANVPLAVMSYMAACMLPGPEGPIMGLPLPRVNSWSTRIRHKFLGAITNILAGGIRRSAEQIRAHYCLTPMNTSVTAFTGQMPLYLMHSTPAYDRKRKDLPDSVHYVGPCQLKKYSTAPPSRWLTELANDRPVVYVTEGTMHSKSSLLLPAALKGLASVPVKVVATTGRHRNPENMKLGPVPPNARIEQWIPHNDLFPYTDVVMTSGGTGTVMAALSAGIPLLIVPTAWDQPENAWRVHENGAGIRLSPGRCTPERVKNAITKLLDDPSYRQNAQRLAKEINQLGGASKAADLLEYLAVQSGELSSEQKTIRQSFNNLTEHV